MGDFLESFVWSSMDNFKNNYLIFKPNFLNNYMPPFLIITPIL
jgi:hypothetical protein